MPSSQKLERVNEIKESNFHVPYLFLLPCITDPVGPPPPWKNEIHRPRWEKYLENPSSLEYYTKLSSPLRKTLKFMEIPLDIQALNRRIWHLNSYKLWNFSSPLGFRCHIISPLTERFYTRLKSSRRAINSTPKSHVFLSDVRSIAHLSEHKKTLVRLRNLFMFKRKSKINQQPYHLFQMKSNWSNDSSFWSCLLFTLCFC